MKFTIEKETLLNSLTHVYGVVERKNTMQILSNVRIHTIDNNLMITGTDMDLMVIDEIAADVKVQGDTTIPAHLLHDIVKKLPAKSVLSFNLKDNGTMAISCGKSKFSVPCLPSYDFPTIGDDIDYTVKFTIDSVALRLLIDKVKFAISTEETRYYLNGIYVQSIDGFLQTIATDGHRMGMMKIPLPEGLSEFEGIIIPRKAIAEIRKLIDSGNDNVSVSFSKTKIKIIYHDIVLISKLIDGTFPDCNKLVPKGYTNKMVVNKHNLSKAIDIASLSISQSKAIKLSLTDQILEVSAQGESQESYSSDEVEVEHDGDDIIAGYNAIFLKDVLSSITNDEVVFMFKDNQSILSILDESTPGSVSLVMPMRVS